MVKLSVDYLGDLRCEVEHVQSGQKFETDAPLDNNGKGERISPTDMVASATAACISTIFGIKAREMNIDLKGMNITATKHMKAAPERMIEKIELDIAFPIKLSEKEEKIFLNLIKTCPVPKSLHPDIEIIKNIRYI